MIKNYLMKLIKEWSDICLKKIKILHIRIKLINRYRDRYYLKETFCYDWLTLGIEIQKLKIAILESFLSNKLIES